MSVHADSLGYSCPRETILIERLTEFSLASYQFALLCKTPR